jgi:hypothetical protein
MTSGKLLDYLGYGTLASRPAAPDLATGTLGLWYSTDIAVPSVWDGAAWQNPNGMPTYTVATLPSAAIAGRWIYVSDESGGAVPAFSDATNWRRVTDRAIVS